MFHRDIFVGVQVACLATCLLWTGCGDSKSEVPAVAANSRAGRTSRDSPPHEAWPIDPSAPPQRLRLRDPGPLPCAGHREVLVRLRRRSTGSSFIARSNWPPLPDPGLRRRRAVGVSDQSGPGREIGSRVQPVAACRHDLRLGHVPHLACGPSAETALLRAAGFLKTPGHRPVEGREDLLAVWSRPELDSAVDTIEAKLGGAGLGLLALTTASVSGPVRRRSTNCGGSDDSSSTCRSPMAASSRSMLRRKAAAMMRGLRSTTPGKPRWGC